MERRYAKKGLTLIAPEVQGSTAEAIQELVKEHKIGYTVTKGIQGPNLSNGIPTMAVFDSGGKLVWVGHPLKDEAEDAIKDALKSARTFGNSATAPGSGSLPNQNADLVALRTWTNAAGRQIEATLLSVEGTTGHFKFANGRPFEYDITKLSADDQEVIQAASAAASTGTAPKSE